MFRQVGIVTRLARPVRYGSTESYNSALTGLKKDLKKAMMAKDDLRKTTIRNLLSAIKNKEIDNNGKPLDEFTLFDLYSKLVNQRKDSIRQFLDNKRDDLVAKEEQEMSIIQDYIKALPVASKEEIDNRVLLLLEELKRKEPNMPMKQVFGQINWKSINSEWKASPSVVKSSVVQQFKEVFKK
ncbi:AIM41 (YOR215C) [Zygosaccharomyces parabailii]|uniref:Altered inheritance of mitochondria protein 41 n=1 Tax=Zygosaccharomyces bailii (strain CLIB 213 / ATCC 58445 / CBS 680 / BCRC 21525 / NBRC 1098 / NCYC 1416 / NRRL Y-2227) TaxID=1333698 RepID=A0A8J2T954_ZYGB2|nr:AIM41 (YOR215C) [Zygosaccharomyces parabailii]CDF91011.1 ZYBA0S09-02806g1_1 [Zygosaccharomyces bailii CLIB 213]CDH14034.1 probable Altered inheritance of mitochondria protein 41, mitochondrial [Zygosaccharomyces bailii ISA1307]SJM86143.1 probable Altered inheritance of mitochondria protein 41, mitochondrial [Zygosaccharomyces bailii]